MGLKDDAAALREARELIEKRAKAKTDADLEPADHARGVKKAINDAPAIRTGEDSMSSRPFYLSNLVGAMTGRVDRDQAKIELEQSAWFSKAMRGFGYQYSHEDTTLVPMSWKALPQQIAESSEGRVMKAMTVGGNRQYDPNEAAWAIRKATDQSAYNAQYGGSFTPPPEFGEPIELLRNEEVFLRAGARQIALPPQGSIQYPRLTDPTTAYAQPEATTGQYSQVQTGDVTLTAKAYSVFVRMSNQLVKFAPQLANGLINADITKSMALKLDLDALEGAAGGQNNIRGLITYPNINTVTASTVAANGNTIGRRDGKRMMSKVFAANAKFTGWVMRYELFLNDISELAADAVIPGDAKGAYLYNPFRDIGDQVGGDFRWLKYPVNCSNQVSRSRVKGSGTALTYALGGDFTDYLFGVHGALELATNMYGDTVWQKNQQELRAISYADGAPRHEASFVLCDSLVYTS
jgi:HK97 family phage major capsid protein